MRRSSESVVDVGLPAYGSPLYLSEAIESVVGQTYPHWRLTVRDNGPGGGEVAEVVKPYLSDARVKYECTGEVMSQADNWTGAIRAGDGPYVALLCDDDTWDSDWLEHRVGFLDEHQECGFVFGSYREIDGEGAVKREVPHRFGAGVISREEFVPSMYRFNPVGISSILVPRRSYEEVGYHFDPLFVNIDREMWMRIAVRRPVGYVPCRDCGYRLHAHTVTSATRKHGLELLRTVDRYDELIAEQGVAVEPDLKRRRRANALLTYALDCVQAGEQRAAVGMVRDALRVHPPCLADLRVPTVFALLVGGAPARHLLDSLTDRQGGSNARRRLRKARQRRPGNDSITGALERSHVDDMTATDGSGSTPLHEVEAR